LKTPSGTPAAPGIHSVYGLNDSAPLGVTVTRTTSPKSPTNATLIVSPDAYTCVNTAPTVLSSTGVDDSATEALPVRVTVASTSTTIIVARAQRQTMKPLQESENRLIDGGQDGARRCTLCLAHCMPTVCNLRLSRAVHTGGFRFTSKKKFRASKVWAYERIVCRSISLFASQDALLDMALKSTCVCGRVVSAQHNNTKTRARSTPYQSARCN
jgi:hypothetical protein